jgi:lipopolysaccharide export system protein LptA
MSASSLPVFLRRAGLAALLPVAMAIGIMTSGSLEQAQAQNQSRRSLTLRANSTELDANTGVVTARGNVQLNYPARQVQATANQARYFDRERRIVLSGDVYVLQKGNSLRASTITYLIDEGRFVALPETNRQVEAIFLVPDENNSAASN